MKSKKQSESSKIANAADDNTKKVSNFLFAASGASMFAVFVFLFWKERYEFVTRYPSLSTSPDWLNTYSWLFSFICVFSVFYFAETKFKMNSETRPMYLSLVFVLIFSFVSSQSLILAINSSIDATQEKYFSTVVFGRSTYKPSKGSRKWLIHVKDWLNPAGIVKFKVAEHEYYAIPDGTKIRVVTKPGYFGHEWIVSRSIATDFSVAEAPSE